MGFPRDQLQKRYQIDPKINRYGNTGKEKLKRSVNDYKNLLLDCVLRFNLLTDYYDVRHRQIQSRPQKNGLEAIEVSGLALRIWSF